MYHLFKVIMDVISALIALLLLSPIFILITIVLFMSNKGKPFFFQKRPGKDSVIFEIIKFKTMNDNKDNEGNLLPDYQRITKFGDFVRKNSLDEIPQLINVLKGDMSIVGPRPLLVSYLPLYSKEENKRHLVKPGITGWAQINGRNAITWKQKFHYDVWYVDHINFWLDLNIIFKTIGKVINSEGVSASEEVTMELFTGTKD